MVVVFRNIYQAANETPALTLLSGEELSTYVNAGIYAAGTGLNAQGIRGFGDNSIVMVGSVFSRDSIGINISAGQNDINIRGEGAVYGFKTGLLISGGGNTIYNGGQINGVEGDGIRIVNGGDNIVTNHGTIRSANRDGVYVGGTANTFSNFAVIETSDSGTGVVIGGSVVNTQLIRGGTGVSFTSAGTLTNSGFVVGTGVAAVVGSSGADIVTNSGTVQASGTYAILLNAGDDTYNGAGGQAIGIVDGGAGNDTLTGGGFSDHLVGGADNDVLSGGAGVDTLDGGAGDDSYYLMGEATGVDTLIDASGTDTVYTTIERSLFSWAFIENLTLLGPGNITGSGNNGNNVIVGNAGSNVLYGQGGTDTILGGAGNDFIFGQAARDLLHGEAGDDTFVYQVATDSGSGANSDVIFDFDDNGNDVIDLSRVFADELGFIGTGSFGAVGRVRVNDIAGPDLIIEVNLSGDATPEMQIYLVNTSIAQIGIDDFIL